VDLVLRLGTEWRDTPQKLAELPVAITSQQYLPLRLIANVHEASGPSVIHRDNGARRIVVSANTATRDLQGVVQRFQKAIAGGVQLSPGYDVRFEGEYQAQQAAARRIALFSALVLLLIAVLLYGYFRSVALMALVLLNVPLALIGGIALTAWKVDNISIATLVGFIAVGGVAARNGIMMLSHYLHLMKHEQESFTRSMVVRGTLERLVPVLMTALTAGIALVPLVLAAGQPGKEILHPVAVVIVGGLISSTLLDLLVTPAVFFHFCRRSAVHALSAGAPAAQ
jgi:Cu/Ag efflux pump CusA